MLKNTALLGDKIVPLKTKCASSRRHYKTQNKTPWLSAKLTMLLRLRAV